MSYSVVDFYGKSKSKKCGYCKGADCKISYVLSANIMSYGIVEYFGKDDEGSSCGYCKASDGSKTHGMWSHSLTCQDYEDLMNRGWRRSGKYCYKPIMHETCCPQYTIRCNVAEFKPSKSQKKVLRKMNQYLISGISNKEAEKPCKDSVKNDEVIALATMEVEDVNVKIINLGDVDDLNKNIPSSTITQSPVLPSGVSKEQKHQLQQNFRPCRKAKEIRLEKRKIKLKKQADKLGIELNEVERNSNSKTTEKSLADYILDDMKTSKLSLNVKLVRCSSESVEFKKTFQEEYKLYKKYQVAIHQDEEDKVTETQFERFLVNGPLQEEYCNSNSSSIPSSGFGAFHQQYFIDDKLIAVGVIDILPNCISSKYFFYDPAYSFLSLGTYSTLREIYFTQSLHKEVKNLKYYYMGFYINSCAKMRYKSRYSPSFLLCPETYSWHPVEDCVKKLEHNKYCRFEENPNIEPQKTDISKTLLLFHNRVLKFEMFIKSVKNDKLNKQIQEIDEYAQLAGESSKKMLLYRT